MGTHRAQQNKRTHANVERRYQGLQVKTMKIVMGGRGPRMPIGIDSSKTWIVFVATGLSTVGMKTAYIQA
jgi:hypothetical protein